MVQHVGAHQPAANVARNVLGMLHGAVVGFTQFQHFLGHFVLCLQAHHCEQHGKKGEVNLFHDSMC